MALIERLRRGGRPLALAGFLMLAVGAVPPSATAMSSVDFQGVPRVDVRFGQSIEFRQALVASEDVSRAELLLGFPDDLGPLVIEVLPDRLTGAMELTYTLQAANGDLTPNTPIDARFRVTMADGREFLGPRTEVRYADDRFDWRTRTDGLVRLHWYRGSDAFADRALGIAVKGLETAEDYLGVAETEPMDVFVYATESDIYEALAPDRENVGGQAYPAIRTLFALISPAEVDDPWVGIVVPHEITHLVFDTATAGDYGYPPKWLDEGVAVYLTEGYAADDRAAVERAVADGNLIPLAGLVGQFPTSFDRFGLAYAESVSAVDYLARTHGEPALKKLIAAYGGGAGDDEAFSAAIGSTLDAFDEAWRADLGAPEPTAQGPRPGEPGPVPADWTGEVVPGGSPGPVVPSPTEPAEGLTGAGITLILASLIVSAAAVGGLLIVLRRRTGGTVA